MWEHFITMVAFPLQLLAALLVFSAPLKKRPQFGLRLGGCLAGLLLSGLGGAFLMNTWGQVYTIASPMYFLSALLPVLLVLGMGAALLAVSFRELLYCWACAYLAEHMVYCIRLLLTAGPLPQGIPVGNVLYLLLYVPVYALAYRLFVRQMTRSGHYLTSALGSIGLTLGTLAVVFVMSLLASGYGFKTIHAVYALFCCVYVLYGQMKLQKQLAAQAELSMQEQLWAQQRSQLELSRENIQLINRKCHDLKHQVAALKHIYSPEEQQRVIDELEHSVLIYDAVFKTGNEVLDTVLTEKSLVCSEKYITLTCLADGKLLAFMDTVDLYALLGNALDNAIEAVQVLPRPQRLVDLQVRQMAGMAVLQLENSFAGELQLKDGLPQSTKRTEPGYHGFGVGSIRSIVEKYDGVLTVQAENGRFTLRAVLPLHA